MTTVTAVSGGGHGGDASDDGSDRACDDGIHVDNADDDDGDVDECDDANADDVDVSRSIPQYDIHIFKNYRKNRKL